MGLPRAPHFLRADLLPPLHLARAGITVEGA